MRTIVLELDAEHVAMLAAIKQCLVDESNVPVELEDSEYLRLLIRGHYRANVLGEDADHH